MTAYLFFVIKSSIISLIFLFIFYMILKSAPLYSRFLNRQPVFTLIMALLMALVFGAVGKDMGLDTLFWHERMSLQMIAGVSLGLLIVLIVFCTFVNEDDKLYLDTLAHWQLLHHRLRLWSYPHASDIDRSASSDAPEVIQLLWSLNAMALPLLLALFACPVLESFSSKTTDPVNYWWLPLGTLSVLLLSNFGLFLLHKARPGLALKSLLPRLLVPGVVLLAFLTLRLEVFQNAVTAAGCLCLFLGLVVTLSFVTARRGVFRVALLLLGMAILSVTNGRDPYKLKYPGLENYYARSRLVKSAVSARPIGGEVGQDSSMSAVAASIANPASSPAGPRLSDRQVDALKFASQRFRELKDAAAVGTEDLAAHSTFGRAAFQRGTLLLQLRNELPDLKPDDRETIGNHAKGDFQEAAIAFERSMKLRPNVGRAYTDCATALLRLSQFSLKSKSSETDCARPPRPVPATETFRSRLEGLLGTRSKLEGAILESLTTAECHYKKAIRLLEEAIKLDEDDATAYRSLGVARALNAKSAADWDQALKQIEFASKKSPEDTSLLETLGSLRALRAIHRHDWKLGDPDPDYGQAIGELGRVLAQDPKNVSARAYRGFAAMWQGDYNRAIEDLQTAYEKHPGNLSYLKGLAQAHQWLAYHRQDKDQKPSDAIGLYKKAVRFYLDAVAIKRDDPFVNLNLDDCYSHISMCFYILAKESLVKENLTQVEIDEIKDEIKNGLSNLDLTELRTPLLSNTALQKASLLTLEYHLRLKQQKLKEADEASGLAVEAFTEVLKRIDPKDRTRQRDEWSRGFSGSGDESLAKALGAIDVASLPELKRESRPSIESERPTASSFVHEIPIPVQKPGQFNDRQVLWRWREIRGDKKPKLVVVATSGGGIVAAYWTALCLTKIEEKFPKFPYHVRLITGASGGMLGASLYTATLGGNNLDRTPEQLGAIRDELAQDFLTPVVRQLVLRDLPSIFNPNRQENDRGIVLESQWKSLDKEFQKLAPGEEQGWRPSLILSPTIVEGGTRLLISNLDLHEFIRGVEFFHVFPESNLKLATAVRMNAAFPYVAPAVNLPTDPPRRVIDAGFLDNYGIDIATEWLERNRQWLLDNTSGVILLQIRAYPLGEEYEGDDPDENMVEQAPNGEGNLLQEMLRGVSSGMQWLTTPVEGVMSANRGTMIALNQAKVRQVQAHFNQGDLPLFRTIVLQCSESAPLSWYLTPSDKSRLDKLFEPPRPTYPGKKARRLTDRITQIVNLLNEETAP